MFSYNPVRKQKEMRFPILNLGFKKSKRLLYSNQNEV